MDKKVYKRLNENTVLCIHKYDNEIGVRCHNITIHYEDTEQIIEFGTYNIGKGILEKHKLETYLYNNDYIIGYKYHNDDEWLIVDRIYDINNRCDLLTDDKIYDYFNCVKIETKISENKCKTLSLGKYKKIK